jgi:hypothetical protein
MKLTRAIPGRWDTTETATDWVADAAVDVSGLPAGAHPVLFTATISVPAATAAILELRSGGVAETAGLVTLASLVQVGPFHGRVTASPVADVDQSSGSLLLHLSAVSSDGAAVGITDFRLTIGTDA